LDSGAGAGVGGEVSVERKAITPKDTRVHEGNLRISRVPSHNFVSFMVHVFSSGSRLLFMRVAVLHSPPTVACVVDAAMVVGKSL
jgi:hypothetical protein